MEEVGLNRMMVNPYNTSAWSRKPPGFFLGSDGLDFLLTRFVLCIRNESEFALYCRWNLTFEIEFWLKGSGALSMGDKSVWIGTDNEHWSSLRKKQSSGGREVRLLYFPQMESGSRGRKWEVEGGQRKGRCRGGSESLKGWEAETGGGNQHGGRR